MRTISWLKNYLSHVKETAWHYQLTREIWGSKTGGKACTYYWFKLPSTLVAVALLLILTAVIGMIGWFFGFIVTAFETKDPYLKEYSKAHVFYPYGYTSKGRKRHIMPWQIAAVLTFGVLVYYLGVQNQQAAAVTGIVIGLSIGALVVLAIVAYLVVRVLDTGFLGSTGAALGNAISRGWNKACPPLIVIPKEGAENTGKE